MEQMDHFQLRQDQQTLILHEIQQHLGLLPPVPPVAPVPSEPVLEAASSDAPPAVPPTSEPPITIPGAEYRALLASF